MMEPLGIAGALIFSFPLHADKRGTFREWFRIHDMGFGVAQANCATSRRGVIRGIHYQPGQAKYVTCVSGEVLDVIVDIRTGSPTYGSWRQVLLTAAAGNAVFIGAGLGHAYQALTDDTVLVYLCSTLYNPATEHAVSPLDKTLGIPWLTEDEEPVMSAKDTAAPTLEEARRAGILPHWEP